MSEQEKGIGETLGKEEGSMKIIKKSSKKRALCINCSPASAMQY